MGPGRPVTQVGDLHTVSGIGPPQDLEHGVLILTVRSQVLVVVQDDVDRLSPRLSGASRQDRGEAAPAQVIDDPRHIQFAAGSREGGDAVQFGQDRRGCGQRTKGKRGRARSIRGLLAKRGEFHTLRFSVCLGGLILAYALCARKEAETASMTGDGRRR